MVAFTDRPYRMTRKLDADSFARLWDGHDGDSFAVDPPNAVLTYWEPDGDTWAPKTVVCEIVGAVTRDGSSLGLSVPIRLLDPDGAQIPSVLRQPSLFVDGFTPCPSPRDEQNVEYFNMMLFEDAYTIGVAPSSAGGSTTLTMQCPSPPTGVPFSTTFYVTLATNDDSGSTSCTTDGLSIPTSDFGNLGYCSANGTCSFTLVVGDSMTGLVYSTTSLDIDVTRAVTLVPQVNEAFAPACPTNPPQPI